MVNSSSDASNPRRLSLSALMDGDATDDGAAALGAWHTDADARASWHAYHLIGDVLRSEDLAASPARDEAFLQALRVRLATEPVPLAPAPLVKPGVTSEAAAVRRSAAPWLAAPVAVAAGFAAVAGLLVVTRTWSPASTEAGQMARAASAPVTTAALVSNGDVVRNARLDRYLEAHRALGNGVAAAGAAEHRVQIVFESK